VSFLLQQALARDLLQRLWKQDVREPVVWCNDLRLLERGQPHAGYPAAFPLSLCSHISTVRRGSNRDEMRTELLAAGLGHVTATCPLPNPLRHHLEVLGSLESPRRTFGCVVQH
jgi:hypothetical protein